jgi:hypothetical protein
MMSAIGKADIGLRGLNDCFGGKAGIIRMAVLISNPFQSGRLKLHLATTGHKCARSQLSAPAADRFDLL